MPSGFAVTQGTLLRATAFAQVDRYSAHSADSVARPRVARVAESRERSQRRPAYHRAMQAVGLGVTPTPDDGIRRSTERVWDESTRPTAPPTAPMAYSGSQRAAGQHLVDVHDHFRAELATVLDLVEQVRAGTRDPGGARSAIHAMTLRQNNWTVGAYCASYCRLLTTHHTLEDISLFPQLRAADPSLAPVLDRLAA